jgi:hypothetical protein
MWEVENGKIEIQGQPSRKSWQDPISKHKLVLGKVTVYRQKTETRPSLTLNENQL